MIDSGLLGHMQKLWKCGMKFYLKESLCLQAYPIILGELEPNGNMNAQIIHMFGSRLRSRLIAQVRNVAVSIRRKIPMI